MKIAVDIGHNCTHNNGAVSIGNENKMVMAVGKRLMDKLTAAGHSVLLCTPSSAVSLSHSLQQRVDKANNWKAELFLSLHENAGGGNGTEVWIGSERGRVSAERILASITVMGYGNRGVKVQGVDGKGLYVLKHTNMTALLVEGCFVDSKRDMELFDAEKMAEAICRGICMVSDTASPALSLHKDLNTLKITGNNPIDEVKIFQTIMNLKVDGIAGNYTNSALSQILRRPLCRINSGYYYAVRYIQWKIAVKVDGIFGPSTETAVLDFQRKAGISPDGIVGRSTWNKIID
jgi:N-acetylmuramoyl-L-alanine amidase